MNEFEFVPVVGYEGLYSINRNGEVKSFISKTGREMRKIYQLRPDWYQSVTLYKDGKSKHWMLHRLIAMAFIPNPENKPFVNHINGTKWDNRIENLEWCTHRDNMIHASKMGFIKVSQIKERVRANSLKTSKKVCQFDSYGNLLNIYYSIHEAARLLNVSLPTVWKICERRSKNPLTGLILRYLPEGMYNELSEKLGYLANDRLQLKKPNI